MALLTAAQVRSTLVLEPFCAVAVTLGQLGAVTYDDVAACVSPPGPVAAMTMLYVVPAVSGVTATLVAVVVVMALPFM